MYSPYQQFINLNNVIQTLDKQKTKILELEKKINALEANLKKYENDKRIENVEYKFDQLKIERLEGTLNIGLSPYKGNESIEDFAVNQSTSVPPFMQDDPGMYNRIKNIINHDLDENGIQKVIQLEEKYEKPLNDQHRHLMIDDIKKQVKERIYQYLNQISHMREEANPEAPINIEERVINQIKRDIDIGLDTYVKNMPNGGNYQ